MQSTSDEVVEYALASLLEIAPQLDVTRDGLALQIARGEDRTLIWNLHDVARRAPASSEWRDEVRDLAGQVVERIESAFDPAMESGIGLRLRPDERVPDELRTGEYAAEPVLDGLWALYGENTAEGIATRPWDDLLGDELTREDLRTLAAWTTLGGDDFKYGDMMNKMEDLPVFTNEHFHPHIAAAMLMPAEWWLDLMDGLTPRPRTLLAMIPSPNRIFISPLDVPEMIDALRSLIPSYQETEEEVLSMHVYRFDGESWRAVP
jgi:hypothetical protein